ncbi:MAG: 16S rRNA (uracil(1498)-N(3))-methyltransferase [Firmicutes bacterium]|nr:16S rRNA (uracil(1498)-N(3))-methyltransferase [Bacillota bacterium]
MPKFFVTREDVQGNYIVIHKDTHHILHVLRKGKGDQLEICDGKNTDYLCEILEIARDESQIICKVLKKVTSSAESSVRITLYQGLPKADKMELILQKGTEIGIHDFVPFESSRTIVHLDTKKAGGKIDRWNKIAESAAKQSGRGNIPVVRPVLSFAQAVETAISENDLVLVCYEAEKKNALKTILRGVDTKPQKIALLIGPEGGFSEEEIRKILAAGGQAVTLGPRILRTETAGMIAAALILYEYDQMN